MPSRAALDSGWADRLLATVGRAAGTRGAILCFHGFDVDEVASPSSMHVPLHLLEAIVSVSESLGRLIPLRDLVTRHLEGRRTAGLVALTSDDAYASLLPAEPFLRRRGVPITVFAVSNALQARPAFWWDRLDEVSRAASPERWRRFEDECGLPRAYREGQPLEEGPVRPLRQWVLAQHAGRWPQSLEAPLTRIEQELDCRTTQRAMTEQELNEFATRTGATIGVHTVSHAVLPLLPDHEVIQEIAQCLAELRSRFRAVVPYLAVPFGLFDDRTLRLATQAGMTASLTLAGEALGARPVGACGLPRFCVVRQYTAGLVALKLSGVAEWLRRIRGQRSAPYPPLPSPTT